MQTWFIGLALLLSVSTAAAQQTFRGTGVADVVVDGERMRFHAFELTAEDATVATATWRVGNADGWLLIDALMIEPDVDAGEPEDPGFGLLTLSFYVDPATGQVGASALHLPTVEFVPNQATYDPIFQGLENEVVVVVTSFAREEGVLRIRGTVDALLGPSDEADEGSGPTATLRLSGTFDLREVVPEGE